MRPPSRCRRRAALIRRLIDQAPGSVSLERRERQRGSVRATKGQRARICPPGAQVEPAPDRRSPCRPPPRASRRRAVCRRTFAWTSWTRTISAPRAIWLAATVAAVPSMRSSGAGPARGRMNDLRVVPSSIGNPSTRSSRRDRPVRDCAPQSCKSHAGVHDQVTRGIRLQGQGDDASSLPALHTISIGDMA